MSDLDPTKRDQLANAVDSMSTEELEAAIQASPGGVDGFLDGVLGAMCERFVAERAAGQSAAVQYDLATPVGQRSYVMRVADGRATVERGTADSPRVTIQMGMVDFVKLLTGKLSGMQAFMTGKLKAQGDLFFAQTYQSWFDQS